MSFDFDKCKGLDILGQGICAPFCDSEDNTRLPLMLGMMAMKSSARECPVQCSSFIYPVLDWESNPGLAVLTSIGGSGACIVIHFCLYVVHKLKGFLYKTTK